MLVVEKCLEKKKRLHYTFEQISDMSGIPLSTVYSFFKGTAQSPSYITVGAICKCLGVSLDAIVGIVDEDMSAEEIERIKHESQKNEEMLQLAIQEHAQNNLLQEATIEANNETIRRQDLRMEALKDRVDYQKKAITWLRLLSVGMFVYSLLTTATLLVFLTTF